jgi:hypothetical protein
MTGRRVGETRGDKSSWVSCDIVAIAPLAGVKATRTNVGGDIAEWFTWDSGVIADETGV